MRGEKEESEQLFSYVGIEERVPLDHPLRAIRMLVKQVLEKVSPQLAALYSNTGRRSP